MEESQSNPKWDDDRFLKTAESLRALRDQAGKTIGDHRHRVSEVESRIKEQFETLFEELNRERLTEEQARATVDEQANELDQLRQTNADKEAEIDELLEQLASQALEFETQITERDEELEQLLDLNEVVSKEQLTSQQELAEARQSLEELRTRECDTCEQHRNQLTDANHQLHQLEERHQELQQQHKDQQSELEESHLSLQTTEQKLAVAVESLAETEKQLTDQQAELEEVRHSSESTEQKLAEAAESLAEAEQQLVELNKLQQNEEQLEQMRRKFELALADVHKLKRENTELQEELASRPEANDQESPELVSLRSERDALAERISELENAPAPEAPDGQQELEELQRRFELAVDDVRQLKQENAELQQQLKTNSSSNNTDAFDGAEDWQAQKARLLASLDAEDQGTISEERREQRATIEGTLSITDRVVAEKDADIARQEAELKELKQQLESRPAGQDMEKLREEIAAEILGDDEAVQTEVSKLNRQQEELETKLREAELEISVQRATIAREQAALEEKLLQLSESSADSSDPTNDKPRRRWLSALGIKDEDEEEEN